MLCARAWKGADQNITYSHEVFNWRGDSSKGLVINRNVAGIDSELAEPSTQPPSAIDDEVLHIEQGFIHLK